MSPRALELPEILSLVGSFIPIWETEHQHSRDPCCLLFKPAPLCQCLCVSKFWHDTLLPVLWHGYWACNSSMANIPLEVIGRNCHLLKILQVGKYDFGRLKSALFGCANLVELNIELSKDRSLNGKTGLTESQLLRSNPLLRRLSWSCYTVGDSSLDPTDFSGLENLESLCLYYWDCSDGRLAGILRAVSRTLKDLTIGINTGLEPGIFAMTGLLQDQGSFGKDSGVAKTERSSLRLGRLEKLNWDCTNSVLDCADELVKLCPSLKVLELSPSREGNLDGLAESLRMHCSLLESVKITFALKSDSSNSLFRRCSTSGLRTIDITSDLPGDDLISGVLHHAPTLEDLRISRRVKGMDILTFLPLLVKCNKLRRLAFDSYFPCFDTNPLEALKQEKWGCRSLEELDLRFDFLDNYRSLTKEGEQEFRRMTCAAGWEVVPLSYLYHTFDMTHLPKLFELLEVQELNELRRLCLEGIPFRKVACRIKQGD
ncbi:hypothetical protein EC991_001061 [Linnemannia zychae]|nr:hypothetical protein EC991_001061 [Linnemannia zychae]